MMVNWDHEAETTLSDKLFLKKDREVIFLKYK
jgi:hypothetical protein